MTSKEDDFPASETGSHRAANSGERASLAQSIVGADAQLLRACPEADRNLVGHLGCQLVGTFIFVTFVCALSIHTATAGSLPWPIAAAGGLLIGALVTLVDRLLFMSHWYVQGEAALGGGDPGPRSSWRRAAMAVVRLALSLGIALVFAKLLLLQLFAPDLASQMERDHRRANAAAFQEIDAYAAGLDVAIDAARRNAANLRDAIARMQADLDAPSASSAPQAAQAEVDRRRDRLDGLRVRAEELRAEKARFDKERIAEQTGFDGLGQSRKEGEGPRYKTAVLMLGVVTNQLADVTAEMAEARQGLDEAERQRHAAVAAAEADRDRRAAELRARIDTLSDDWRQAEGDLNHLKTGRAADLQSYIANVEARPTFVAMERGLLARVNALNALTAESPAVWQMTISLELLLVFVESSGVLAKLLFGPPTLYAVRVAARQSRELRQERRIDQEDAAKQLSNEITVENLKAELAKMKADRELRAAFAMINQKE